VGRPPPIPNIERATIEEPMRDLLPGGYVFTHLVFWTVVSLVIVGTNAVAIMLSVGIVILGLEALKGR
jgi:hypothetical protein